MSIFIWYGQSPLQKSVIVFLFLKLIKNMLVQHFHDRGLNHKETSPLICSANEWTGFYVIGTPTMNELTKKV